MALSLGLALRLGAADSGSYDSAATTLFAAMSSQPTAARKKLYNDLIVGLKSDGVWTLLDGLYLFAAADSQAASLNIKNPGTYNVTQVNSPTFTVDQGFTGGSTKALSTGFDASSGGVNYTQNNASLFEWSLYTGTGIYAIGGSAIGTQYSIVPRFATGDTFKAGINSNASADVTTGQTDGSGFRCLTRSASNAFSAYSGSSLLGSPAIASAALASNTMRFLNSDGTGAYTGPVAAGGMGSSLSGTQVTALYNRLHTYLQAVAGVA